MTEREVNNELRERTYVRYPWWSYVKGLLMQYGWALENRAHVLTDAQMDAICRTIDATMALPSGAEVLRVVDMVLIKKTHTIAGAALAVPVRVSWIGLAVCGVVFAACLAGRLVGWLRRRPRGVKLGVMSAEEICAACRRMRQ